MKTPSIALARMTMLYRVGHGSTALNVIAGLIVAYAVSRHQPGAAIAWWLAGLGAAAGLRIYWLSRFKRAHNAQQANRWANAYALVCLAGGLVWGTAFFIFTPQDFFVLALMNVAATVVSFAAIASLSASLRCYFAHILPIATAQALWIYGYAAEQIFSALLLCGFYFIVVTLGALVFRRTSLGALKDSSASQVLLAEQQALFNNSLVGLAVTRARTFVRVNDHFAQLYGVARSQLEGQPTRLIYADEPSWLASVTQAEAGLVTNQVAYEREYAHPDGRQRWLLAQGTLINPTDPDFGALWVITDITARKNTEMQLATREQAYRNLAETYSTLLETMPAMIWTTDSRGRYTFASERGTRALFGVSGAEVTGKVFSDFVRPDDFEKELAVFRGVLKGGVLLDHASEGTRHDGRRLVVSVSGAPLHDAGGNIIGASGTNVDITDRQDRALELRQARDLLRNAIESIPDGFALFDASDRLVQANQRYIQLYTNAKSFSEISGQTFEDVVRASIKKGEPVPADFQGGTEAWIAERVRRHQHADGQPHTYRIGAGRVIQVTEKRTPDGGIVGVRTDITELENARTVLTSAIDSMSDGFVLFGPDDRVVLCNRPYAAMLEGFAAGEPVVGMHLEEVIRRQIAGGQPMPPEFTGSTEEWITTRLALHRRADGVPHVQQLASGRWVQSIRRRTSDGGIVVLRSDVTSVKQSELAAHELAQHDQLTGLPNRRLLHDRLLQALARARRANGMVAVLLIDLDGFKPVNDAHGHRAGDEVLRVVAVRLRECVRAADTVARYGGDEFVVVLDGVAQPDDAGAVAAKIIEAVARPIQPVWATSRALQDVTIGSSIGISLYPASDTHPDALIRQADLAMYQAKQAGRGRYSYYAKTPDG